MVRNCPNCGKPLKEGYLFCGKCGYKLTQEKTIKEEKTVEKDIDEELEKKESLKEKDIKVEKAKKEEKKRLKEEVTHEETEESFLLQNKWKILGAATLIIVIILTITFAYINNLQESTPDDTSNFVPAATSGIPPSAYFTYSKTSATVYFTDQSTDSDGIISKYYWNFGDGKTSSSRNPTHQYKSSGTFTIILTVTDNDGNKDTYSIVTTITMNKPPTASFTFSTSQSTVSFISTSSDSDGTITQHYWTFGDGKTSYNKNPTHTYDYDGTFTVALTVTDNDGATDSTTKSLSISNPPDFKVIDIHEREGYEGANRVGYVDVTVKNNGGSGKGTVDVWVCQGSESWKKSKTVTLNAGDTTTFTLRFPGIHFWSLDEWYVCGTGV